MTIESWSAYKQWVETTVGDKKDYYYRGQENPSWALQTSFNRYADPLNLNLIQYLDYVIPEVTLHVCAEYNELFNINNADEFGCLLSLIQHHGFPTPLLDWTLSPYVAAYFAYRNVDVNEPKTDHVRVYIFDYQLWIADYQQIYDLRSQIQYVSIMRSYPKYNPRLIPQRGTYTLTNVSDIEAHLLRNSKKKQKTYLYTVTLPVSERVKVMRDLNLMGINEMTLFPGMDGVCRTLKEQFFCPDTVGLSPSGRTLLKELMDTKKGEEQKKLYPVDPSSAVFNVPLWWPGTL